MITGNILLLDIETSPIVSYTWGIYEQDVIKRIKTFTILSCAYKWLGGKTQILACDSQSEYSLLRKLRSLLCKADVVIAHNGDSFDIKKINARMIVHKLPPPSPYITIDTKKEARRVAGFDSNALNNLGVDLGEGEKVKHRGFDMWEGCMAGVRRDWTDMKHYNKRDVDLLERVYLRLRPWMQTGQSLSDGLTCPKCGSSCLQQRGFQRNRLTVMQRLQCQDCHGWSRCKPKSPIPSRITTKIAPPHH